MIYKKEKFSKLIIIFNKLSNKNIIKLILVKKIFI